jgi:hypothetical protein
VHGKDGSSLAFRVEPALKAALAQAAADDDRSVSSLIARILKAWLTRRGYLPKPEGLRSARRAGRR